MGESGGPSCGDLVGDLTVVITGHRLLKCTPNYKHRIPTVEAFT